jgi:DNA polymerase-3 subunit alpha
MNFVHLHLHTQYSLLDGLIKISDLVNAVTDHGSMMGAIKFYDQAMKEGIKPIIGCEIYLSQGSRFERNSFAKGSNLYHLILLAENNEGYRNLLLREHSAGIIALSSCLQGEIPSVLQAEGQKKASEVVAEYVDIFGKDSFFLEVQANGLPDQQKVNEKLVQLSKKTGVPLVATNDCHYLRREDHEVHDILLCLQTGKKIDDDNRMRFETNEFYLKPPEMMFKEFGHYRESLSNTMFIFERCNVTIDIGSPKIPKFFPPEDLSSFDYLKTLAWKGMEERLSMKNGSITSSRSSRRPVFPTTFSSSGTS